MYNNMAILYNTKSLYLYSAYSVCFLSLSLDPYVGICRQSATHVGQTVQKQLKADFGRNFSLVEKTEKRYKLTKFVTQIVPLCKGQKWGYELSEIILLLSDIIYVT
jgi:hypothetical protein